MWQYRHNKTTPSLCSLLHSLALNLFSKINISMFLCPFLSYKQCVWPVCWVQSLSHPISVLLSQHYPLHMCTFPGDFKPMLSSKLDLLNNYHHVDGVCQRWPVCPQVQHNPKSSNKNSKSVRTPSTQTRASLIGCVRSLSYPIVHTDPSLQVEVQVGKRFKEKYGTVEDRTKVSTALRCMCYRA